MATYKQIKEASITPEKRDIAHNDYIAFYVGRPISILMAIPFANSNITPDAITIFSFFPSLIGFLIFYFAKTKLALVIAWLFFVLWNLCDGIDGNVARYRKEFSKFGGIYDAMSGYLAMILSFFGLGIAAAHFGGMLDSYFALKPEVYIILGAFTGFFQIFPRLVMHKTISDLMDRNKGKVLMDRGSFSVIKIISVNLSSVAGGAQVLMLVAILLNIMDLYTICYFIFMGLLMLASLHTIFKQKG